VGTALAAADVFVIPSYIEGWSISATEAVCAGLPLIHTDCGSGAELCEAAGGLLIPNPGGDPLELDQTRLYEGIQRVDPPNTARLVEAFETVCGERERRLAERPAMRSRAVGRFSPRRMAREYIEVFVEVIRADAAKVTADR